jgi:hypothetical protein
MGNRSVADCISKIKDLLDELQEIYEWDIEKLNQALDEKIDLLDKYVAEADSNDN